MYLSATEGDKYRKLAKLGHWPEKEVVNNKENKMEAVETLGREAQQLANTSGQSQMRIMSVEKENFFSIVV